MSCADKEILTNSRTKAARACQRLHHIEYVLGFRPVVEAEVLRFGTLMHRALEAWWLADEGRRLIDALAALADGETDPFDLARAQVLITAYDTRWGPEMGNYLVLSVEAKFLRDLRNPATGRPSQTFALSGRIDVIVKDLRDGRVLVVEHKTSAEDISPGSEYWRKLRIDSQVSTYFDGAASLGHEVAGCLYDVIGKPALRPLKATPEESRKYTKQGALYANQRATDETPDEYRQRLAEAVQEDLGRYLQRGEVSRLESEMDEARYDIWQTAQQIIEAKRNNRAPRNPDACSRWGRTCPYFDVCTGAASLEDPALFKKKPSLHPELSGETAPREGA